MNRNPRNLFAGERVQQWPSPASSELPLNLTCFRGSRGEFSGARARGGARGGPAGAEPGRAGLGARPARHHCRAGPGPPRGRKVRRRARVPPQRPARRGPRGPWRASRGLTGAAGDGRESLDAAPLGRRSGEFRGGGEGAGTLPPRAAETRRKGLAADRAPRTPRRSALRRPPPPSLPGGARDPPLVALRRETRSPTPSAKRPKWRTYQAGLEFSPPSLWPPRNQLQPCPRPRLYGHWPPSPVPCSLLGRPAAPLHPLLLARRPRQSRARGAFFSHGLDGSGTSRTPESGKTNQKPGETWLGPPTP